MTAPDPGRLVVVAGWDADEVRSGVAAMAEVADALPSWWLRVEAIGHRLDGDGAWTGLAGASAARSLLSLAAVGAAVARALDDSLAAAGRVVLHAQVAAALARSAVVAGYDDPRAGEALGHEALASAGRLVSALDAAHAALAGLGARDAFGPLDFADLSGHVRPLPVPVAPTGPHAVAVWWTGLPALAQAAFLQQRAAVAGALDGLPAAARDRANRLLLARALRRPHPTPTARAVAAVLATHEAGGGTVQLHLFDEAGERVAVGLGDLDSADALTLLVPGIATTPDDDLDAVTADVARAVGAAEAAGGGAVAGVAWLGYRPPIAAGILLRGRAAEAGPVLDTALDGLAAARAAGGRGDPRTTVVAHSYGTVVVDEAADAPGRLAADAVVLLGSPGMQASAGSLEVAEVYDAASSGDPISWSSWFGVSPWAAAYGAVELPVRDGAGHSAYLDPGPTLAAIGGVVAGRGGPAP